MNTKTFSQELLDKMDTYQRATNYLFAGQIYLYDNVGGIGRSNTAVSKELNIIITIGEHHENPN